MADLLGISTSALRSLQTAMSTTGNNISNVGTEGYSRQRVEFATLPSQLQGGNFVGSGVTVNSVNRVYDQFIEAEILSGSSRQSQYEAYSQISSRVDQLFANGASGLSNSIQNFFTAAQNLAANPTGLSERQVFLSEADALVKREQNLYSAVNSLNLEVNQRLEANVSQINDLSVSIAQLNDRIIAAEAGGRSANSLQDQRDVLLQQLSAKVGITTVKQDDGAVNVQVGNGYALVVGAEARGLQTATDPFDASRLDVYTQGAGTGPIGNFLTGGELKGLLDVRERTLDPVVNQLGLISLGLSEAVNQQQALGIDLDGAAGGNVFATNPVSVNGSTFNAGSAAPVVQLDDVSALNNSNYALTFSAGAWTLTRESDGTSVTGGGPLSLDGMTVDVSAGSASNGDRFLIRPGQAAAASLSLQLTDPRGIAAAAALISGASTTNTGSGALGDLQISSAAAAPLGAPVTLTFNPDALGAGVPGFDVSGGITATIAYDPATDAGGTVFSIGTPGVSFNLSGTPASGDSFNLNNTTAGSGDNRNALVMADLQFDKLLYNGNSNLTQAYSSLVTGAAINTQSAANSLELETTLLQQAEDARSSVSGVNLDEEAANLLKFQQQYQAAAQLVSVADSLFQTLLNATGR